MGHLGKRIREARKSCHLTQQKLAEQTGLAIKTVQDIEAGQKNTSFETLSKLIDRLGISPNDLFLSEIPDEAAIQHVIGKLQPCTPENRKILLATFDFLAEQLIAKQYGEDSGGPK